MVLRRREVRVRQRVAAHGKRRLLVHSGPIRRGERVCTYGADQSDEGRGYVPMERTNQMRGEGMYLWSGPIRRGER
eukprot:2829982-Pyramimonas_sp.AAC.1